MATLLLAFVVSAPPASAKEKQATEQPKEAPGAEIIDALTVIPNLKLDVRYATTDNFLKKKLYPEARCLLRREVAERLLKVQKTLEKQGYGLIAHDCYRPLSVQKEMWKVMPKPGFVANPKYGSVHNRGGAVDVSLFDLKTGKPLPMPSGYDEFTKRARHSYKGCTPDECRNRGILKKAMTGAGFEPLRSEWWHYNAPGARKYPVMDLPFDQIMAQKGEKKGE